MLTVTADTIKGAGGKLLFRHCGKCHAPIYFVLRRGEKPGLESCNCRPLGRRTVIPLTWAKIEALIAKASSNQKGVLHR